MFHVLSMQVQSGREEVHENQQPKVLSSMQVIGRNLIASTLLPLIFGPLLFSATPPEN